jgi:hypothetical protein
MSNDIDNYSVVHYFTSEGWKSDLKDVHPEDHIETWEENIKLSSGFGAAESSTWRMLWGNPAFTPEKLALVHDKFPKPTQ